MKPTLLAVSIALASTALAQGPVPNQTTHVSGPQLAPAQFNHLQWRAIGPAAVSGRIEDIAVGRTPGQPDQLYVAGASGGVFKSTNGGTSWTPVFDNVNALMSIGDLAVAPSNANVVWIGSGEANNPTPYWGDGVYKSVDAGKTWKFMGLKETRHVGRIVINPTNPDIVFVAGQGHMWGSNPERGIFRTTDGGVTWKKVLYVDDNTGGNDIVMDPRNPQVLYASTYQRQKKLWGSRNTGPGSNIYRSADGGDTWTKLTKGIPAADRGRIGLDIFVGEPKVVYATIEVATAGGRGGGAPADSAGGRGRGGAADSLGGRGARGGGGRGNGIPGCGDTPQAGGRAGGGGGGGAAGQGTGANGLYRTVDGGETWEKIGNQFGTPAGYESQVRVDPKDRLRVYLLGSNRGFWISDDAGRSFRDVFSNVHSEDHALWVDPDDPNHLMVGGDGGLSISWDRGTTWDFRNNIPLAQFYEMDVDNRDPYNVCGGMQDNGVWCISSATRNRNGVANSDSYNVGGGDGFHIHFDPNDQNYAFLESQNGNIQRMNFATLQKQAAKPGPGLERPRSCLDTTHVDSAAGRGGRGGRGGGGGRGGANAYRWGWDTPIAFSNFDSKVVYTAANVVFKSMDRGGSWKVISPNLTANVNRDTMKIMGVLVSSLNNNQQGDTSAARESGSIYTLAESPLDARLLYAGSTDGRLSATRDGGVTWIDLTPKVPGLPQYTPVTSVVPSRFQVGRVYATFDGHVNDDLKSYVYVSEDFGSTWRSIAKGIPDETPIARIAEHPKDPKFLALGGVRGVHFSNDGGAEWHSLSTNMPTVPVGHLVFQARDNALVVGTFGRGFWILDDVGPLQALTADNLRADAVMASITRGREWDLYTPQAWYGYGMFFAPNPDFDPIVSYYVRDAARGQAEIKITDALGGLVRTLRGSAMSGLNHVCWDMRMDAAVPPDAPAGGGNGGRGAGGRGGGGRGAGGAGAPAAGEPVDSATAGGPRSLCGVGGRGGPPGGGGGGGGGAGGAAGAGGRGGGAATGPLVLPGKYHVTVKVPGASHDLTGDLTVEADPQENLTPLERKARFDAIMSAYNLQKTLVAARTAARGLVAQSDSIKTDLTLKNAAGAAASADSLSKRLTAISEEVTRVLTAAGGLIRPMESFPTLPTADQRQQMAWANEDATKVIAEINRAVQTTIPALYARYAGFAWPRKVPIVGAPTKKS